MPAGKLTKNDFLGLVSSTFLAACPAWTRVYEHRRHYKLAVGRYCADACLVFLSFEARPDRYWFGQGVGWCPSLDHFLAWQERRENPRDYPKSGLLRLIKTLDKPLDFENDEMSISIQSLYTHYAAHNLEEEPPDKVLAGMLSAIDEFALPYLCMMLKARHGLEMSASELRGA